MAKYEIMLILDPKKDLKIAEELANSVFKDAKVTKLDRTELAYEINKSKTAIYVNIEVEASGDEVKEFTRKANINKSIWRNLIINLDSEKGRAAQMKKGEVKLPKFEPRPRRDNRRNFERNQEFRKEEVKKEEVK